jgi:hypothetical protein
MNRFVYPFTVLAAAIALALAGGVADLHAQRGGAAPHGAPAGVGRPDTAGRPATAGKPDTVGQPANLPKTDATTHDATGKTANANTGKPTVADQLTRNTNLASQLQSLFPAGTDLQKEAAGFRNLGQFVAAAHVAHNLNIPFDDLKAKMTGTGSVSLGAAIKQLKPDANAKTETDKAETEASTDLKSSAKAKTAAKTE